MYSALQTYYPHGKVTKRKLWEVLNNVGSNVSDQVRDEITAKLAALS